MYQKGNQMLEELKKEYKELGEARTKFCHNVTTTFIKLYEELNEKLAMELWDISITTNPNNKFVSLVITLNNLEDCRIEQFPSSKFICFDKDKIRYNPSEINREELLCYLDLQQLEILNNMVKFLIKYYFHLNIKDKVVQNESIDYIFDKLMV